MAQIDSVLQMAVKSRAADLHIASGSQFVLRHFGKLKPVQSPVITVETVEKLLYEILSPAQQKMLEQNLQLDFSYEIKEMARFRGNAIRQRRGLDVTFRVIPLRIPELDDLRIPLVVKKFCDFHQGIILVTGATGQGKTTTMASMIDYINSRRPVHILTVEDPIEFVHPIKKGVVNQRQLGAHTLSFANALRAALREDPDVIMVGELRDLDTIRLAVSAAETGHLVIGTLATSSAPKTVDRIIDSFPPDEQNQIRAMLAGSLRAVVTQRLLPRADGKGLALACEIMIGTVPVSNLIRTERTFQLKSIMQTGRAQGMVAMDDAIDDLFRAGIVDKPTARFWAENKKRFA
jgi:twitching motility protein PilT